MNTRMIFSETTKVLVVSDDQAASSFMMDAFAAMSRFEAVHLTLEALLSPGAFEGAGAGMIVLDVEAGAALEKDEIFAFRHRHREVPLVVVSENLPDNLMRQLFRLNGSDWLKKPLERRAFMDMVSTHAPGVNQRQSLVHAVVGASGGVGASVIAASLAQVLAQPRHKVKPRVELFDMDFSLGSLGQFLGLVNDYDLKPVIANPARVDVEFLDLVRQRHARGFSLLSFRQPEVVLSPKGAELVLRMLDVVSFGSDHTVLDVPYYATAWKDDVLSSVNTIYIVTEMTVPALRQAKDLFARLERLRGNSSSIHVVVNRYRSRLFGMGVRKRQTQKIFKDSGAIFIRDDWATLSEALNRGVLPVEVSSRSPFCSAVGKLGALVK